MSNNFMLQNPYSNSKFIIHIHKDDGKHCPFIIFPPEKSNKDQLIIITENEYIKEDVYYLTHFQELLEKYNIKCVNNKFKKYEDRSNM